MTKCQSDVYQNNTKVKRAVKMGNSASNEKWLQESEEAVKDPRLLAEIAILSYEEFVSHLGQLNKLSKNYLDPNGKRLIFAVKKGTDTSLLWKGTVKIGCVKVDPVNSTVESYRLMNLLEFLRVFKTLKGHIECIELSKKHRRDSQTSEESPTTSSVDGVDYPLMTASMLLQHMDKISSGDNILDKNSECCICLERKHEVILPCTHSYCLPCIEQWNVNHKTCPICREKFETTDDTWVISEAPDLEEISAEISTALNDLSQLSPKHRAA